MWNSLSETSAKRYYWELRNQPGSFWNGQRKKVVTDPQKRSEYRSTESSQKYHPRNSKSTLEWELKCYQLWLQTSEYTSEKVVL